MVRGWNSHRWQIHHRQHPIHLLKNPRQPRTSAEQTTTETTTNTEGWRSYQRVRFMICVDQQPDIQIVDCTSMPTRR